MVAILFFILIIAGEILLFAFGENFTKTYGRSCMHLSHVIVMVLYVLSIGVASNMTSFFGILCWIALAAVFVYYVKQYGFLSAIGVWLYNTMLFILVVGMVFQLTNSRKKR